MTDHASTTASRREERAQERPPRRYGPLKWSAAFSSGVRIDLLKQAPTDEGFFCGLGMTVIFTGALAVLTSSFALAILLDSTVQDVLLLGLFWGALVFNLDRLIVGGGSASEGGFKKLLGFLIRLTLAAVIGFSLAEPMLLRIFDKEIAGVIDEENRQDCNEVGESRVRDLEAKKSERRAELVPLREDVTRYKDAYNKEIVGTGDTRQRGIGPEARRLQGLKEDAEAALRRREAELRGPLRDIDNSIAGTKRDFSGKDLPSDCDRFVADDGLIERFSALHSVESEKGGARLIAWAIRIIALVVDIIPVLLKTLDSLGSRKRPYYVLLDVEEEDVRSVAKIDLDAFEREQSIVMAARDHADKVQATEHAQRAEFLLRQLAAEQKRLGLRRFEFVYGKALTATGRRERRKLRETLREPRQRIRELRKRLRPPTYVDSPGDVELNPGALEPLPKSIVAERRRVDNTNDILGHR